MCDHTKTINSFMMAFPLGEALDATGFTIRDLSAGKYSGASGDAGLAIGLAHILGNICVAWHRKMMVPDEVLSESQAEYEEKIISIPNWGGSFQLVDNTTSHPAIDFQLHRQEIAQDTVNKYLCTIEVALRSLVDKVEHGQFDKYCVKSLSLEFEPLLRNLCLAWHLRYVSNEEAAFLDPAVVTEIGTWLPCWEWDFCLTMVK